MSCAYPPVTLGALRAWNILPFRSFAEVGIQKLVQELRMTLHLLQDVTRLLLCQVTCSDGFVETVVDVVDDDGLQLG